MTLTVCKIFRALQSEPFNRSLGDIANMTIPMVRNLLRTLDEPEGKAATPEDVRRAFGLEAPKVTPRPPGRAAHKLVHRK